MKLNMKKTMKKGITLIEIILAIVLIAVILGITIPKLMSNSAKAEIKQTVTSDIKSIFKAAKDWRKSSAMADSSFRGLDGQDLASRLPSNMSVNTDGVIFSAGLRTGNKDVTTTSINDTGIKYVVRWQLAAEDNSKEKGRFSIAISVVDGTNLGWSSRITTYAQDMLKDTIAEAVSGTNNLALYTTGDVTAGTVAQDGTVASTATAVVVKCGALAESVCFELMELN
jgi:type II secretory pathway pseudopilin PulG